MAYKSERAWSDKFVRRQIQLLAWLAHVDEDRISIASEDDDRKHGVDVRVAGKRVALRTRRHGNRHDQFTVRIERSSYDRRNELDKIKAAELDYLLYCHATPSASRCDTPEDDELAFVVLLDLAPFRIAAANLFADVRYEMPPANDRFLAFTIDDLGQYGRVVLATVQVTTNPL